MTDPRIEQKAREVAQELNDTVGVIDRDGCMDFLMAEKIIAAALQSAVAEEREEIAQMTDPVDDVLAACIRARGEKETA